MSLAIIILCLWIAGMIGIIAFFLRLLARLRKDYEDAKAYHLPENQDARYDRMIGRTPEKKERRDG